MKVDGETAGIMVAAGGLVTVIWKTIRWLIVRHDRITRSEAEAINTKIAALEAGIAEARETAHNLEVQLVKAWSAYRLIAAELQRRDPHAAILIQAQQLLNDAYPVPSGPLPADMAAVVERMDSDTL